MEAAEHWPQWAVALQNSGLGIAIRHSTWIYPFGNVIHVLGMALLVGSILALDFRFLGFGRRHVSVEAASRLLTPLAIAGILLLVPGRTDPVHRGCRAARGQFSVADQACARRAGPRERRAVPHEVGEGRPRAGTPILPVWAARK